MLQIFPASSDWFRARLLQSRRAEEYLSSPRRSLVILLALGAAAAAQPAPAPVPEGRVAEFSITLGKVAATAGWVVESASDRLILRRNVTVHPPSAPTETETMQLTVTIDVVVSPYLDEAKQHALLGAALKRERQLWRSVRALECEGKDFSDHYVDGLCFRAKSDGQKRRVAAYRKAREHWLNVPRYHHGEDFAVTVRVHRPEPTDGYCGDVCDAMERNVAALLVPYSTTIP